MDADMNIEKLRTWLILLRRVGSLKKSVDASFNESFGVSLSRFDVLAALERSDKNGLKAGELTKLLVVTDGNTTQVTNKLVRDGLLIRKPDDQDRRCVIYALTEAGTNMFHEMAANNMKQIVHIFRNFNAQDLTTLQALLDKFDKDGTAFTKGSS
jgi:DNA-binding MarR family transcriptional regulator